jgi:hypothetical protein
VADSSKPPTSDKERAERLAKATAHGGVVVLRGGVWAGNVLWQDEYDALPQSSPKRVGYQRTSEFVDNPLGWGRMRVYRSI